MANGVYGTVKPAIITSEDVDIFYFYRPTRGSEDVDFSEFKKIDSDILSNSTYDNEGIVADNGLPGMYNLRLPIDLFGNKGFYTVYIKPKEVYTTISDIGVLSAYPDIKGVIINTNNIPSLNTNNNNLVGYRIEYFDNGVRQDYFRVITSNNKCEGVSQNLNDSNQKSVRYRYNESSSLIFCTVTPSTSSNFKTNATPYIGKPGQEIVLINTKFNPIMIEIEMVDHDVDTISTMLEGNQIRNLDNGLITTYNEDNEIYMQSEYGTLKSSYTGAPLYDIKKKRTDDIDFTQNFNEITEGF